MKFKGKISEENLWCLLICCIWITMIDVAAAYKGKEELLVCKHLIEYRGRFFSFTRYCFMGKLVSEHAFLKKPVSGKYI